MLNLSLNPTPAEFPSPASIRPEPKQRIDADELASLQRRHRGAPATWFQAIRRWLYREARKAIIAHRAEHNGRYPSPEDLDEYLQAITDQGAEHWTSRWDERPEAGRISPQRLAQMVSSAAVFALWRHQTSAKGGRTSSRRAKYSMAMLEALPAGMSKARQAEALGCSQTVIAELRRAQKSTGAFLESLHTGAERRRNETSDSLDELLSVYERPQPVTTLDDLDDLLIPDGPPLLPRAGPALQQPSP